MAEALQLDQQPEAARATLAMAWEALDEGTADPLERAGLLRVQASLEMSLGNLGELASRHVLIWFLNDCGMGAQALELLERTRPLYRECGESEPRVLLPWLEARIYRGLGQLAAAERGLAVVLVSKEISVAEVCERTVQCLSRTSSAAILIFMRSATIYAIWLADVRDKPSCAM